MTVSWFLLLCFGIAAVTIEQFVHLCRPDFVSKKARPPLCIAQKLGYKNYKLSPDRVKRLQDLGFEWDRLDVAWEEMFAALTAYKQVHGDCLPVRWNDNPTLKAWCNSQSQAYGKNELSADCVKRLEDLGFEWERFDDAWEGMFAALAAYTFVHRDCNVPFYWKDNPRLGRWCESQRQAYEEGKLSPDRVKRLEDLGFVWKPLDVAWEEMFAALTAYKQTHGDCNVPAVWKDNSQLGFWCGHQRTFYKNDKLSADRVKRLEQFGFRFVVRKSKKK